METETAFSHLFMTVIYDFVTLQTVEVSRSVTDVTFMSFLSP